VASLPTRKENKGRKAESEQTISTEKTAEEASKKQAAIIDLSPDAIIVKNMDETITFWNKGAEKLYGYTKQEALGQKINTLLKANHSQSSDEVITQLKQGKNWTGEITHCTKNKNRVTVQSYWSATLNAQGDIVEILESNIDITERKELEDSLKESEERFLLALKNTPVIVGNLDRSLRFTWAYNLQSGFNPKDLIGKEFGIGMNFENINDILSSLSEVISKGKPARLELRGKGPYGERIFDFYFEPKRNAPNEIVGVSFTALNITERKQAEETLEKYKKSLEKLVEERTRQLKDSERLAAIGATAGMVGHDIRNPLQAIVGDLYLAKDAVFSLVDGNAKKNLQETLNFIEENLLYIEKIVADLQDFARPLKPIIEKVSIERAIGDAFLIVTIPNNLEVSIIVDEGMQPLDSDLSFLKRVLVNLIQNAVQAMPIGGKLTVHAYNEANCIAVSVKDTGVGISEEVKSKLFTPMVTTKAKGQGFGLAVVKRLIEVLGGTVTFESQEGKGSTFTVHLPQPL
jgi:PAS domain S-box-containing protein